MCINDDDSTELTSLSAIDFGDALLSSKEHLLWEKLFCAKTRANSEFSTMANCKIVLSDCHNGDDTSTMMAIERGYAMVNEAAKKHAQKIHSTN
jgi:hypothetical protein